MTKEFKALAESARFTKNYILNALPEKDFKRILPDLEKVVFEQGEILWQPGDEIDHVYFPNDSMISEVGITQDGESTEVGVIGREGIVGMDVLLGTDDSFNQRLVQMPDSAIRMKTAAARNEFKRGEAFHDLTLQYVRLMLVQVSQSSICNRLHSVEQRLARWLLMCRDRASSDQLKLTQEFLATMLGTYRSTVTVAALTLQNIGFIQYRRGRITICDRDGLEDLSCECYRTVRNEYDRAQYLPNASNTSSNGSRSSF